MIELSELQKLDRVHPYPAKFTVDLAIEYIEKFSNKCDVIYDPFVGSGTSLLAAKYTGRNGYGTDINHIAILISKFKSTNFTKKNVLDLYDYIDRLKNDFVPCIDETKLYFYDSINHWFCDDAIRVLSYIKNSFSSISDENEMLFVKTVFSAILNSVSNQESDTRYAAVYKPRLNKEYIFTTFVKKFNSTLSLVESLLEDEVINVYLMPVLLDSNLCDTVIPNNSVDLIITSPPYPNTYDYYLYHKHRMNWLGFDVKFSMEKEIGSRREFSSLRHPKEKFDDDLYSILTHCNNVLKSQGRVVIVMGDGKIQGEIYDAKENLSAICSKIGWKLVGYSFSQLDETSRSFQKSYRTKGKKEHILVFEKV